MSGFLTILEYLTKKAVISQFTHAASDHTQSKMEEENIDPSRPFADLSENSKISKSSDRKSKAELMEAYLELALQIKEKEKRIAELTFTNKKLVKQIRKAKTKTDRLAEDHERQIKKSELLYSTLFYQSAGMKSISETSTGKFLDINISFASFLELPREGIIGKTSVELNLIAQPEAREWSQSQIRKPVFASNLEMRLTTASGKKRWVSVSANIIKLDGKDCFLSDVVDITQRKKAEDALNKLNAGLEQKVIERTEKLASSEIRFRSLIENSSEGITLTDKSFNVVYRSNGAQKILQIPPFGNKINFIHPEEHDALKYTYAEVLKNPNIPIPFLGRFLHESGKYIWLEGTYTNLLHLDGVNAIVTNYRDVTKRKNLEILLQKANSLARIGSWEVDLLTETIYWDDITREIHEAENGFVPDLATGIGFYKEGPGRELITEKVKNAINLGEPWELELEIVTAKNNPRWIRTIGETEFVGGKCVKIYGSFQDIDERKKAEEKLNESLNRYRRLFDTSPIAITEEDHTPFYEKIESLRASGISKNYATYFDNHNEELYEMLGRVQILGVNQSLFDLTGANNLEDFVANRSKFFVSMTERTVFKLMDLIRDGGGYFEEETKIKALSGEIKEVVVRLKYPASPPYNSVAITMRDVTKQKEFEQKIVESENRMQLAISSAAMGIWYWDIKNDHMVWDKRLYEIYDINETQLGSVYEGWLERLHPEDKDRANEVMQTAIKDKKKKYGSEFRIIWDDLSVHYIKATGITEYDDKRNVVRMMGIHWDVTENKLAEEEILKLNRLYMFLASINQMILRVTNEATLFSEACRIAIDHGKFKMAWIGMIDDATQKLIPVKIASADQGYFSNVTGISADEIAKGRGPTGTALREGKYVVCNDIENDLSMTPWKNSALERGYFSSTALPIKKFGKVVGVINFYASEKNFFDSEEIRMLEEATGNLAFAIEIFDKERERQKSEKDLEKANERLLIAQEISLLGYWELDLIASKHYSSEIMFKILNIEKTANAIGMEAFMKLVHPEDRQKLFDSHTAMIEKNIPQNFEFRIIQQDGSIKHLISKAKVILDVDGHAIRIEGTTQDITERKKAELVLLASQTRTKKLFDSDLIGFIFWDANGEILDANDRFLNMTGYSKKDLQEKKISWNNMTPAEFAHLDILALEQVAQTGICKPYEKDYLRKDGSRLPVMIGATGFEDPNFGNGVAYVLDITERKQNEKEIQSYKDALDQSAIVAITDQKGIIQHVNENFCKISKFTSEELIGQNHRIINSGYHPKSFIKNLWKTIARGKIWRGEMCNKAKDGMVYWVDTTIIPLLNDNGKPMQYIAIRSDITERKKAEEEINKTTEQLHKLTTHLQTIREEERTRIAREIHDHMGQQLTAIKMDAVWLDKQIPADQFALKSKLQNIIELLDESHQSVHKILNELRPSALDNNGLLEGLQWLGKQFTESTGAPVHFVCNLSNIRFSQEISICIFRVYQESLTNIMRYAEASKVLSSLNVMKEKIVLAIEDDGKGFDLASLQNKKSFGLLGMRERVHSLNGKIDFVSSPGKGTKIVISLPNTKTLE